MENERIMQHTTLTCTSSSSVKRRMSVDTLIVPSHSPTDSVTSTSDQNRRENLCTEPSSVEVRRRFIQSVTSPTKRKGFVKCKLCITELWGPNGMCTFNICIYIYSFALNPMYFGTNTYFLLFEFEIGAFISFLRFVLF